LKETEWFNYEKFRDPKKMNSLELKYEARALESRYREDNWDLCKSTRWKELQKAITEYDTWKYRQEYDNEHPFSRFGSKDRYKTLYALLIIKEGD